MEAKFQKAWLWVGEQLIGHGVPMSVAVAVTLGLVMLGWLTFGPRYKQRIAALEKEADDRKNERPAALTGIIKSAGNVTIIEGDQHNHYTLPAGAELTVPKTAQLTIGEHTHSALIKADGTVETRSSWDPGRGDLAAPVIENSKTFAVSVAVFNDWRYAPRPQARAEVVAAMGERLRAEGETPETEAFLLAELKPTVDNVRVSFPEGAPGVENVSRFEWMVLAFKKAALDG